jgi:hypothetical protein
VIAQQVAKAASVLALKVALWVLAVLAIGFGSTSRLPHAAAMPVWATRPSCDGPGFSRRRSLGDLSVFGL